MNKITRPTTIDMPMSTKLLHEVLGFKRQVLSMG
jgi:hypothetical protein